MRDVMSQEWGEDWTQLDPKRSMGYTPEQTGTEEDFELFGPKEFSEIDEDRTFSPTPFNTGGPVRLMKMKHGY